MASEWPLRSLATLMDIQGGAQPPASTFRSAPLPGYIRFVQIRDFETDAHLTFIKDAPKWRHCSEKDVLIARYGASVGRICRGVAGAYNVALAKVVPREGADLEFLYHLLRSNFFQAPLAAMSGRSAQAGFNKDDLAAIEVPLPPIEEQRAIAEALGALDDRIANLRQINATLQAVASALFKSRFVDFDGMTQEDMQESELGLIPKEWRVEEIGRLVQCVGGATPSTKDEAFWQGGTHHWATPKDLSGLQAPVLTTTERLITDTGVARISSGLLPAGTLLMSSRAPIGYLAITAVPVAINQGFIAMPPGGALSPAWLLFWAMRNMEAIKQKANGSTFMEISKAAFRPIKVIAPSPDALAHFDEVVAPMLERIKNNEFHVATLSALRDTLLPRLISGRLRAAEVMRVSEQAA